ncbi:MAG: hypothetical protein NWP87_01595 [Winogradskyella sp.]|nr:hypothetical protein [Winogradskyella sp.]
MIYLKRLILLFIIITACQSFGLLTIWSSINNDLKEVSAVELDLNNELLWVIEDAGNSNSLIGLNKKGAILKTIIISNAKNNDWEDLTSDEEGNIYIGDFGNNNEKRKKFMIYKINHADLTKNSALAETIEFNLPKGEDSKDFESFFLFNDFFYIFSKETKQFIVLKVPNKTGKHRAEITSEFNLNGKNNKITSAAISQDGKTVVLLNHDKLWKLSNFEKDDFFSGNISEIKFEHHSQKEGICFKTANEVIITDERKGSEGGNIYSFKLN